MISFFPDINVWLALSVIGHTHNSDSSNWLSGLAPSSRLLFTRYTQMGLLRLLSNQSVMGQRALSVDAAWVAYDRLLLDPRLEYRHEPRDLESEFRGITGRFAGAATKSVGDCYLLAFAKSSGSTLVTFDRALHLLALKEHCAAVVPGAE